MLYQIKLVQIAFIWSCMLLVLFTGCVSKNHSPIPSINDSVKRQLGAPINCATAQADIKLLEEERASVAKRIVSGVRSVFPISAVAGLLMGDYADRVHVATGQYNDDLGAKIGEIRAACGIAKLPEEDVLANSGE